jgi:hypothetical protein
LPCEAALGHLSDRSKVPELLHKPADPKSRQEKGPSDRSELIFFDA